MAYQTRQGPGTPQAALRRLRRSQHHGSSTPASKTSGSATAIALLVRAMAGFITTLLPHVPDDRKPVALRLCASSQANSDEATPMDSLRDDDNKLIWRARLILATTGCASLNSVNRTNLLPRRLIMQNFSHVTKLSRRQPLVTLLSSAPFQRRASFFCRGRLVRYQLPSVAKTTRKTHEDGVKR